MKKIFIILTGILLLFNIISVSAQEKPVLPSQTGIVRSIVYEDLGDISGKSSEKQVVTVEVLSGDFKGERIVTDNMLTSNPAYDIDLSKGDKVILHLEPKTDVVMNIDDVDFFITDIKRDSSLLVFAGFFALLLVLIGGKKGLRSIISIILTVLLIFFAMIPLILSGISPIVSSIIIGILSTIITIYLVGGFNAKSTSAIISTGLSLVIAGGLSVLAIKAAHLTGFSGEESLFLYTTRPDLNFSGILTASMIIAALGALMDTAVSIASTINEIHETDSSLSISQLFKSGMNVGRDIIGTMSNTLILVYLGSSLPLVLLSVNVDLHKFFNLNQVATEILSALIGSTSILLCVPVTAVVASLLIKRYKRHEFKFNRIDIKE